jgi:hypothetical protein
MYRNRYEFRIFGLKRSGNHPVIMWLASLFNEPVYFYNHCDLDPFRTRFPENKVNSNLNIFYKNDDMYRWNELYIKPVREKNRECIIYSYENKPLKQFTEYVNKYINNDYMIGKSEKKYDVLILRDFYNFTASTVNLRRDDSLGNHSKIDGADTIWTAGHERMTRRISLWKEYAKEFLGETDYLKNKLCISFNKFISDEQYRIDIATILELNYSDITLNYIGGFGQGSSFSGIAADGKANTLRVLDRWRIFKDNKIYWDIINKDKEVIELSNKIFGVINE